MTWYKTALKELSEGKDVALINRGESMRGLIEDGQIVILGPVSHDDLKIGDIVMARLRKGRFIVHLIQDIGERKYLIGNNIGGFDGWVTPDAIYAKGRKVVDEIVDESAIKMVDENGRSEE